MNDPLARRPGGIARLLLLVAAAAGFFGVFSIGFPPGSRDRLPILVAALGLALVAAWNRERALAAFAFLFPLAGLGDRLLGGADAIAWPVLLFAGLAGGWTFRFLYDFESAPDPSRADRSLRALLGVWALAAALAVVQARTLWAILHRLRLRAVNVNGLPDAGAIRASVLAFAVLATGAGFFFLLRRSGAAARARALALALAGVGVSAAVAVAQWLRVAPAETRGYWRMVGRLSGAAMDPNALGLLCGLGVVLAAALAAGAKGRGRAAMALGLVVMAAGLVLSGSRSGVGLALIGFAALLGARGFSPRARVAAAVSGVVLVAAIGALRVSDAHGSAGARLFRSFDGAVPLEFRASARPVLWESAVRLFGRHPLEGAGLGAFYWQLPNLLREQGRALPMNDNPGNAYLQALAETGAIGFLLTVAFALVILREAAAALRDPASGPLRAGGAAALVGFLVVLLTGSHWFAPDVALFFFLIASVVARTRAADAGRKPGRARALLVALYAAAACVAMLGTDTPEQAFRYGRKLGFYRPETGPGGQFCWTARRFAVRVEPGQSLRLALAHFTPEGKGTLLTAEAAGAPVFSRSLEPGEGVRLLLSAGPSEPRVVRFELSRAFVPRRLGISGDSRELGLIAVFEPGSE